MSVPAPAFANLLNEQIAHEFGAHQQYVAIAVYFDGEALPRLASFFYAQAIEERNHAMMMVKYLDDADAGPVIPGVVAPQTSFADVVEPVALALAQEKRVSDQIDMLAKVAREHSDYSSEQFIQWFIKEQVEEISSIGNLLKVVTRAKDNPLLAEEYLVREAHPESVDATAPEAAGGAL